MSTEQDITHNIQAINPNLEKLKQAFPHCFDKNGDFDFAKFKAELDSNDINIAKEGYGLNWLGKSYARILASDAATTLLKEDEAHNAKPENTNSQNLLIKGDNLEVLKHLSNAYYEKVKMIYIDPPYNTGSDGFVYNDDRKFTAKQLQDLAGVSVDEAKRILEFTQSNSNSHSAWLTFMYPRLYIAKQLLKDDGVIFVSIDDNEVAQLRLLMDEVFGEENFVANINIQANPRGRQSDSNVATLHDYLMCFAKNNNIAEINGLPLTNEDIEEFGQFDEDGKAWRELGLRQRGAASLRTDRPDMFFPIYVNPKTCKASLEKSSEYSYEVIPKKSNGIEGRWMWGKEKVQKDIDRVYARNIKKRDEFDVFIKDYLERNDEIRTKKPKSIWIDKEVNTEAGGKIVKSLLGPGIFSFPKPIGLIKKILLLSTDENDLILDFFAGSGTTAHSVMQLNKEDGGNRKYILVQLPELIDAKKSKAAYDFVKDELGVNPPTIFEITKERIIRAANQINAEIDSKIDKLKNELPTEENKAEITKNLALKTQNSFKVFETTPIWDDYDFKAAKLANAEKLFDDEKLTEADVKALFTTWKTYDGSPLTEPVEEVDLVGYKAYYTKQKLYLMHKGFSTVTLKALLEQIDADANFNPTAIIAFGYYFESKSLREIAENIKTYNNKKNIDIDFITRY